jgi:LAS superfamily LD-carboxypeptidase LdcB
VLSLAKLQKYALLAGCAIAGSLVLQSCQSKYEDPGVAQYHNPPIAEQISQVLPDLPIDTVISSPIPVAAAFSTPTIPATPTAIQAALTVPQTPSVPTSKIAPTTKLARVLAGESVATSTPAKADPKSARKSTASESYRVAISIENPITKKYQDIAQRTGYLERYPEIGSSETVEYQGQRLHKDAATAFEKMRQAAAKDNVTLQVVSGFRGIRAQAEIFEGKGGGLKAAEYSAPPGHSQHHTGLAIDINSLQTSFRTTKAFGWLKEHGREYGFMLPYANTSGDLGPSNEPWHWVYVGKPPAMNLMAAFLSRARQTDYDPLGGDSQLEAIYRSQTVANTAKISQR